MSAFTTSSSAWHTAPSRPHACVHWRVRPQPPALPVARRAPRRRSMLLCRAESKEYYDYKDMPPLPLTVQRIHVPQLGYTVVDKSCEPLRLASLAIFYDIHKDDQYRSRLNRKSAITALCMYDRDDVDEAQRQPGSFPNIDLLQRVYSQGLDVEFVVEEYQAQQQS